MSWKAILLGLLAHVGASFAAAYVLIMALRFDGTRLEDVAGRFRERPVMAVAILLGLLCSGAGGYTAARVARREPVRHAAALGLLIAGVSVGIFLVSRAPFELSNVAGLLLGFGACVLGGALSGRSPSPAS